MATIEIDGKKIEAENGQMVIEVADQHGIKIPRFCYHKKLSVAANCRMCLVEVEKSRKPLPACATPVTDGMKVFTQSKIARDAQKAVMEFLLINHPLDCPICDQGGECELQDVSMGFGNDISEYTEGKRAVDDDNLGPLIATEMTRCIHCTRCVRFGREVAGFPELGVMGRGEAMQIGTYIEHSVVSEVSGNVIDLCPVGALTSKPFRYQARSWELQQSDTVSPHDCIGSNMHVHTRRQQVMRVVPKDNESVNETWIADRDRFSYTALQSPERIGQPMIRQKGEWQAVDWHTALRFAAEGLKQVKENAGPEQIAALASPSATTEEHYLLQKLMRAFGVNNVDHRIRELDSADQHTVAKAPIMTAPYAEIENKDAFLLVGSNIQREQPLAGLKLRKASLNSAAIMAINPADYAFNFNLYEQVIVSPAALPTTLAKVVKALATVTKATLDEQSQKLIAAVEVDDATQAMAQALFQAQQPCVILGATAMQHPHASVLRHLAQLITSMLRADHIFMTDGANSAGAWLAGMVPHRSTGGAAVEAMGLTAQQALAAQLKAYVCLGVEPELDCANSGVAAQAMDNAAFVVMMTPYISDAMKEYASVILPTSAFTETAGTYVNIDGQWQSFRGNAKPFAQARPAWKVLRVLGNVFELPGFDYLSAEQVLQECQEMAEHAKCRIEETYPVENATLGRVNGLERLGSWPIYRIDATVRRASTLQDAATSEVAAIHVNANTAQQHGINGSDTAIISQDDVDVQLPVVIDERLADNTVYVPSGFAETAALTASYGPVTLRT